MGIKGIDQVRRLAADLGRAGKAALPAAREAVQKATQDIESIAKETVTVDTGFLKSSISSEFHFGGSEAIGRVGPSANYGAFVENGTHKMRPQPYMRPATDAVEPGFNMVMQIIADRTL